MELIDGESVNRDCDEVMCVEPGGVKRMRLTERNRKLIPIIRQARSGDAHLTERLVLVQALHLRV